MEITEVKRHIKNREFDNFYIFTGDEVEVQRIYINKIAEVQQIHVNRPESIIEIVPKLKGKSIFNKSACYVIRDDTEFVKNETAWEIIKELLQDNILILQLSSVDKRSKFYKRYKDKIVEFNKLPEDVLIKYIQRKINLSERSCRRLISICEGDYGRILLEIDKIEHFSKDPDKAFESLVKDGTIYQPAKDALFEWVNAVLKREVNRSFELYQHCERKEISPLVMLSVLYNNAKQVLQVADCIREGTNIEKSTGLTSYQIKLAKEKCGYYGIGELVYMLKQIRATEMGIKVGKVDEKTAIPQLLVKIL